MKKEKICCVIVTYNIGKIFSDCFESVINQVDKVVIVDNGSTEETVNYLKELKSIYDIEIILNKENIGIACALNQGVKYALDNNYSWILTMDNDSEATTNMVKTMIDTYNNININDREKIWSIFPENIEKGINEYNDYESNISDNYKYVNNDITSGNLLKKEVFEKIGFYNESLFIDSVDHEFCYRIIVNGGKLIKINGSKLKHSLGNTKQGNFFGKKYVYTNHSSLRRYYMTRNRFYIWNKFNSLKDVIRLDKRNFIMENIKILLWENNKYEKYKMTIKGYIDYKKGKFGKLNL